ncbi:hypothetical protein EXIGLDRAFT_783768 [Exidia glandulosa HHB12029]|uniref:Uncharacterized protein n=1 Tax=Exidia glandulosa HHB12029 TaxID=1314781 RepID=A0A166MWA5_EXIGL|nr:hypothetical protein EXIGLDRAFT_783768 [Exidia glandulosa HHB12029]
MDTRGHDTARDGHTEHGILRSRAHQRRLAYIDQLARQRLPASDTSLRMVAIRGQSLVHRGRSRAARTSSDSSTRLQRLLASYTSLTYPPSTPYSQSRAPRSVRGAQTGSMIPTDSFVSPESESCSQHRSQFFGRRAPTLSSYHRTRTAVLHSLVFHGSTDSLNPYQLSIPDQDASTAVRRAARGHIA